MAMDQCSTDGGALGKRGGKVAIDKCTYPIVRFEQTDRRAGSVIAGH